MISKILGLFFNKLTADDKYSRLRSDNLTQPIQIHLFKNQKKFSERFSAFFKSRLNFEHVEIKDDAHSVCMSEITHCGERS